MARFQEGIATLALQYGLTSKPSLDDPDFVSTLVFDSDKAGRNTQAEVRLPVPEPGRGADLGADASRVSRRLSARTRSR